MKKRLIALVLCVMMCLTCMAALAENETIIPPGEDVYRTIMETAVVGDTVYLRVYTRFSEEIWYWRKGMAEAEKACGDLVRASNYHSIEAAEELLGAEAARYAIAVLFSDGEQLLGLNPLNGLVYQITFEAGKAVYTDVVELKATFMFYRDFRQDRWYWSPDSIAVSGGYLYWLGSGWSEAEEYNVERITRFSLADGSFCDLNVRDVRALCAYRDGTVFFLTRKRDYRQADGSYAPYTANVYDPMTDKVTALGEVGGARSIACVTYAPEMDAVLYQDDMAIRGGRDLVDEKLYAYVNTTVGGRLAVVGDQLVHATTGRAVVRTLVEGLTVPDGLQILNSGFGVAQQNFASKYVNVPLEFVMGEARLDTLEPIFSAEGSNAVDVMRLPTAVNDRDFVELRDSGMLMDLSGDPAIASYVAQLYPAFCDLVTTPDGAIWAIPAETSSYSGVFINRKAMQDLGLTQEEMPTNLVELCAFVNRWNAEFAAKYPTYACIEYTEDTRWYLLDMMVEMWIAHCQAQGQQIHFDDPVFRELLTALSQVEAANIDASMQQTDPEISDYKTGLFWMRCQLVGNWASYMEDFSDRIFIPMTLTEDTPFIATVDNVDLWVVNRNTESEEYALKLLQEIIGAVNDKYAHVLLTTRTEPVRNPFYAESLAYEEERLAEQRAELAAAQTDAERERLEKAIAARETQMAAMLKREMYSVTPSAIENYVNVLVPALHINRQNILENDREGIAMIEGLMRRWLDGEIDSEQFIQEADARLMMLEMTR